MIEMSRRDEQRGWRRAYSWGIGAAIVLGLVIGLGPTLLRHSVRPERSGMDQGANEMIGARSKGATGPAEISSKRDSALGVFLTDESGHPVYLFKGDQRGQADARAEPKCYDQCAKAWPPLLSEGTPKAAGDTNAALIGTVQRKDGSTQVTYNGWPLYRFVKDFPGTKIVGQGSEDFGHRWSLVTPAGMEVQAKPEQGQG